MIDPYESPEWQEVIHHQAELIKNWIDEEIINELIRKAKMEKIEGTVTIDKQRYASLLVSEMELDRLESGGVDNWEWYSESLNPDDEPDLDEAEEEIIKMVRGMRNGNE